MRDLKYCIPSRISVYAGAQVLYIQYTFFWNKYLKSRLCAIINEYIIYTFILRRLQIVTFELVLRCRCYRFCRFPCSRKRQRLLSSRIYHPTKVKRVSACKQTEMQKIIVYRVESSLENLKIIAVKCSNTGRGSSWIRSPTLIIESDQNRIGANESCAS